MAEDVAGPLVELVQPFAAEAIEEHRRAGRAVVLATTSPHDLVAPFAARLGLDDVLATRYRVAAGADGRPVYDGTIDGEFVWSAGKARAVSVWATANLVELADSHAYSDSVFDLPLLNRVGYPVAVNPDPRLLAWATLRGWPRVWFNAPPGVPKPAGVEPQQLLAAAARPELLPWLDLHVTGADDLPAGGGVVVAANHRSYLDPLVLAHTTAGAGRPARFLAKKEVTDAPLLGALSRSLGAIRVDRGGSGAAPMAQGVRLLRAGELVAVFPQGTIPRGEAFFKPELQGRTGAVRLAMEAGVRIVPVGLWGTERAWPRCAKLPYLLNFADPPTVTVAVGTPYRPAGDDPVAATRELLARIVDLLPPEARQHRAPTPGELAATYPDGRLPAER